MSIVQKTQLGLVSALTLALLTGCGGSSSSGSGGGDNPETNDVLPDGLTLSFVDASSPKYIAYNTTTETSVDLNDLAASSGDSAVQKLAISDTSTIGFFYNWADFRMVDGVAATDMKYLLMKPSYTYQSGATIDSDQFVQLVHFHGEDLAAHSADEFANPEVGSAREAALIRLNDSVADQQTLENEVAPALPGDQTLCRAYVDPYLKFEHENEHEHEAAEVEHDHGDLIHFALTESGRMYFYKENASEELESAQPFVELDGVSSISDCSRTTIAHASDDGVLVFIPDVQKLYLVDNHGADYHQHSVWDLADILPAGFHADLMAAIGEGSEHDHDHEHEE